MVGEEYHTQYYEVIDSNLLNINNELKANAININAWDGYISSIEVVVPRSYKATVFKLFKDAYGIEPEEPIKSHYTWYFPNPHLVTTIYALNDDGPTKTKATLIRHIDTPIPSKELIYQARKNINDI